MRTIRILIMLTLSLAIVGYGIGFGMINSETITINYLLVEQSWPVGLHVSLALLLGASAGFIAALGFTLKRNPRREG